MIFDQSVRIEQLEGCVVRLTGRVFDLQRQVLALAHPQPHGDITEVSDLSTEAARLRGVLESGFDFLRREIKGSSEHASTQFTALLQSVSRALNLLDTIRLSLVVQSVASQPSGSSHPSTRAGTSTRGRGRWGRGRALGRDPSSPHPISDSSDSDPSSHELY